MPSEEDVFQALVKGVAKAGSQNKFAKLCGVSYQYLSEVMTRKRRIGPKLIDHLGYVRETVYRKKNR